jgi:hypothetical protein
MVTRTGTILPEFFAERRGQVVNTPPSYGGGPGFYSGTTRTVILIEFFFVIFSVFPDDCRDSTLKLGHDRFLSNPYQLIIHLSYHWRHTV